MSLRFFAVLLIVWLASFAAAQVPNYLIGRASVIDGDTIEIHGQRIRLQGMDAPEASQLCRRRDGSPWRCGQQAAITLANRIAAQTVTCRVIGIDRYQRALADCVVNGSDLAGWLVINGWAVTYYDRAGHYTAAEDAAKQAKRGIWDGSFERPKVWRRRW